MAAEKLDLKATEIAVLLNTGHTDEAARRLMAEVTAESRQASKMRWIESLDSPTFALIDKVAKMDQGKHLKIEELPKEKLADGTYIPKSGKYIGISVQDDGILYSGIFPKTTRITVQVLNDLGKMKPFAREDGGRIDPLHGILKDITETNWVNELFKVPPICHDVAAR